MTGLAERIIVALDAPTAAQNLSVVRALSGRVRHFKVGLRTFYAGGAPVLEAVAAAGAQLFLDLKLHDIPATVRGAAEALAPYRPALLTVHASGGEAMVRAAVEGLAHGGAGSTCVLGVTVLTSMGEAQAQALGWSGGVEGTVDRLAATALAGGAGGLVCSGHEAGRLRAAHPGAVLVVPGIRPAAAPQDDQTRTMTPRAALAAGADWLVVGRPVWRAEDPVAAWEQLVSVEAAS